MHILFITSRELLILMVQIVSEDKLIIYVKEKQYISKQVINYYTCKQYNHWFCTNIFNIFHVMQIRQCVTDI